MSRTHSKSRLPKALLATMVALGLTLPAAPAASAAVIPAKWGEETSSLRIYGTLQVEDVYENTVSCSGETNPLQTNATPGGSTFKAWNKTNQYFPATIKVMTFNCGSDILELPLAPSTGQFPGQATYDTEAESYFLGNGGFFTGAPAFTNGFGGFFPRYESRPLKAEFRNPGIEIIEVENEYEEMEEVEVEVPDSRLIFSHTKIGEGEGHIDIYASGTLIVDDTKGNPRTLSH